MSALGRAAVRFAARTLPRGIRARYREEWLADLDAAKTEGVNPAGVVVGTLLFSATLNRDAPQLSGMPLSVMAARHARQAIAFFGVAAVLLFGTWINGQSGSATGTTTVGGIVAVALNLWLGLVIATALAGIIYLWRAALLASASARISAGLGTLGVVALGLAMGIPVLTGLLMIVGCVALIGSVVCGVVVWSSSPQPIRPAEPPLPSTPTNQAPAYLRRSWWTVGVASIVLFGLVAVGTLDLLVWSPTAMAPGYTTEEIYAALSPQDRVSGIVTALTWTVFWGLVTVTYLVVGIARTRRPDPDTRRNLVLVAAAIAAVAVFLQWFAGFSLGNSISDTLPPFFGVRAGSSALFGVFGQLCLCLVILGWISPRRPDRRAQPA